MNSDESRAARRRDGGTQVGQRLEHAADRGLAVGRGAGAMEGVGELAATGNDAEDFCAARNGGVIAFQHQRAGALGHHKPVAVLGERL